MNPSTFLQWINKYNQIMQEHQQARQRITPYVLTHNINTGEPTHIEKLTVHIKIGPCW